MKPMVWTTPRNVWQWMLLFTPAVLTDVTLWLAEDWINSEPRFDSINRVAIVSLATLFACSLPLAIWVTRNIGVPNRIANTLSVAGGFAALNSFVAFGGCALVGAASDAMSR